MDQIPQDDDDVLSSTIKKSSKIKKNKLTCCDSITYHVSNGLGQIFYRLGYIVAEHPWNTIIVSWLFVIGCSVGLIHFHSEKNPLKLWIPQDSKFIDDTMWIMKSLQEGYRVESVLVTAPNVLEPNVLKKVAKINKEVISVHSKMPNKHVDISWNSICFKIPIIAAFATEPSSSSEEYKPNFFESILGSSQEKPFNPSIHLNTEFYCGLINNLPVGCMTQNLLELWDFSDERLENMTKNEILHLLNVTTISPVSGHQTNYQHLLGGIRRNETGHIISATSLLSNWMVYVNFSAVDHEKIGNLAGTEDWTSEEVLYWEGEFLKKMEITKLNLTNDDNDDIQIDYRAGRSFGDISSSTMFQDMDKIVFGALLMFIYMQLVLSKFGWIEFRLMFGSMGLLSVGMAFIAAVGICSISGVSYGPVHTSLPFLLMGLGVDDIFILMSCWREVEAQNILLNDLSLQHQPPSLILAHKIGLMMKHAGASITVTSFTDVVAFLIGASTILPSLESFCIYAAVGVFLMYILVITFVVAILVLDERRIAEKRNSFLPCIIHRGGGGSGSGDGGGDSVGYSNDVNIRNSTKKSSSSTIWCELNLMHRCLEFLYSKIILTLPGKIITIFIVIGFAGVSIESLLKLEQKFDPTWFIPKHTYLHEYLTKQEKYYPDIGYEANIFMGQINYTEEMPKIQNALNEIKGKSYVENVNAWIEPFRKFCIIYFEKDIYKESLNDTEWHEYLSKFLFSSDGGRYQANLKFDKPLKCGEPAGNITVTTIDFRYKRFDNDRNQYVPAMHEIRQIVENMNITSGDRYATSWGKIYANWITDEVIDVEVLRNILLALVCVMACTTIMIANLQICFYIFICVLLTLINVCGFMQRWGLTIDLVSCIGLELAVGLCVDYAAHVGHTFLTIQNGNRQERVMETILSIGAAVLYGGGSTLLALAMLANSEAYTFNAFFKIFLLVILFGLFHGVVFLPVILSICGPNAYVTKEQKFIKKRNVNGGGGGGGGNNGGIGQDQLKMHELKVFVKNNDDGDNISNSDQSNCGGDDLADDGLKNNKMTKTLTEQMIISSDDDTKITNNTLITTTVDIEHNNLQINNNNKLNNSVTAH